ncbi:hypothetical protein [Amycolatopsis vastitatis]|uniref:hypothetical protein n=1 Tax=Amycolatopsis vastitatis TaxID=1905142 RepID=UPI0011789F07|nr:hypothetical protein [Amycolatopsis vastitatis]
MSATLPSPTPPTDGSDAPRSGGNFDKLIDRLPTEIGPAWFLGAMLIFALAVVGVASVAGGWIGALGGGLGLGGFVTSLRKNP